VLLGYNAATKALGPITRSSIPRARHGWRWATPPRRAFAFVDEAKITALKAFAAEKYLTVTVSKRIVSENK